MKHHLRIPAKEPYAYLESEFEGTAEEAITEYRRLTDLMLGKEDSSRFEKIETFTGETVLYDPIAHEYRTLEGKPLLSGSAYKKSLEKPFDLAMLAPKTAAKHGITEAQIRDMWKRNGEISSGLGTSLHQAMEQWFKHRGNGTEKNYHLPKHPFLRKAVESFPLKDVAVAYPELMVSDVANGRVGQIDLLVEDRVEFADETAPPVRHANIIDYKSDAEIAKNIDGHWHQLSFYAHILMAKGWEIEKLVVANYTDDWKMFESPVLPLKV